MSILLKDELIHELKQTLNAIKLEEKGVYVQASTLGSLEALLEFLKTSEVPVSHGADSPGLSGGCCLGGCPVTWHRNLTQETPFTVCRDQHWACPQKRCHEGFGDAGA